MIHDVGYLSRRDDVRWYPWTLDAIRLLTRAGFLVCVTTNQGGIGLGFYTEAFLRSVHAEMDEVVRASGGRIGGWYFCPHHPNAKIDALRATCACRKPGPGMIRQAASEHAIDLSRSFVVGDKIADVGLGVSVGARPVLVKTGYGQATLSAHAGAAPGAAYVAEELMDAAEWILRESGHPKERV